MGCCENIPFRTWIAVMTFMTACMNYTTIVIMSISIISMVERKGDKVEAYCIRIASTTIAGITEKTNRTSNVTTIKPETETMPNYGPRYEWDEQLQGFILGAYFWGYSAISLVGGVVSELLGAYRVIFWAQFGVSILNSLCVWMAEWHYVALCVCRFILGLVSGLVYPAMHVLIAKWAPPAEKGKFVAMLLGNTLGISFTWPLVGAVTMRTNWAWGFHVITFINLAYCVVFYFVVANTPEESRFISQKELSHIKDTQGAAVSRMKLVAPYKAILLSRPFWVLNILHFGNLWGLYLQLTLVPKFMSQVVGFNLADSGGLAALPQLARMISGVSFGILADVLETKGLVSNKFIRKFFIIFSHLLPGVCLLLMTVTKCHVIGNISLLVLSLALNGAVTITNLRNPQDLSPNFAGTVFSIVSFTAGMSGFIAPAIAGAVLRENSTAEWSINFILGGTIYCFCGIVFILFGSVELQPWNEPM